MQESVNVLGTDYRIIIDNEMYRIYRDGETKVYSKEIRVRPTKDMLDSEATEEEQGYRYREVFRHELFHVFFLESGLEDYAKNEQLVDWLAIQSPKIFEVFKELGVI